MREPRELSLFDAPLAARADAWAHAATVAVQVRERMVESVQKDGPATPDELAHRLGLHFMMTRPRATELRKAGRLRATGKFRPSALGNWQAVLELAS